MQNIKVEITGGTPEEHEAIKAVLSDVFAAEDSNPTPDETKAIAAESKPVEVWTDSELDAMTEQFTEDDLKDALALRSPEMRGLLRAKPEGK